MNSLAAFGLIFVALVAADPVDDAVLAVVNGHELTQSDLDAYFAIRGIRGEVSDAVRKAATRELVDRELVRQFLERRKTVADPESLATAMRVAKQKLAPGAEDVTAALKALGLDEQRVSDEVALTLAWNQHAKRTITDGQMRDYWKQHQRRLDGTRLRVSQIVLKYQPGESSSYAPRTSATDTWTILDDLRERIVSGKESFADAARKMSQAPTAANGGDVGFIEPRGDLPFAVSRAAYLLEKGEVSDIVLSPFGAHLVTVTGIEPGELSLEDARPVIFKELADLLWDDTVASERKSSKIEPTVAQEVFDKTSALYAEFVKLSENPKSPEYEAFYKKFKQEQRELLRTIGNPEPKSVARDVKNSVLVLGAAVEAYHRPDMERAEQELYKAAADEQMTKVEKSFEE